MEQIICIVGPTASGKTALSVALAKELGAEIVSCDSMQLYCGMDIGTAKPTAEEREGIPHHMIDILDPAEDYSVSRYVNQADICLQDIFRRNKPAIIVGGTGLYVDSLIAGREFAPFPQTGRREELTEIAQKQGISVLIDRLRQVDPESAERIHPSNEKRVIRALEVYLETGKTMTQHNLESQKQPPKYHPVWVGLDYVNREALYARIDARVEEMYARGLVDEVRSLLERGIPADATSMQAIGYKELCACIRAGQPPEAAMGQVQQNSRRYAKRQRTWFRRNGAIHWLEHSDQPSLEATLAAARALVRLQ